MKEYTIKFLIDDKEVGSSTLSIVGKTLLTHAAEDEFYAVLRKNEKSLLEQAEDEEKEKILNNLSAFDEEKLAEAHMRQADGVLDDDLSDDYEHWITNVLELDELKDILK
mgnify:CR=1 FL=1